MGSRKAGRGLKKMLEVVRFILAEFGPKPSHGDPIRGQSYGFGTHDMCCVETEDMCCVETEDLCCLESPDMRSVESPDMCSVE